MGISVRCCRRIVRTTEASAAEQQAVAGRRIDDEGRAAKSSGVRHVLAHFYPLECGEMENRARQTLAGLGYRVLCAADGEEALRLCEQNTPQIAVLDVVMPKLRRNGYGR